MEINDIVYVIHNDHICKCTVKGKQLCFKDELHYHLFNHYTNKDIDFLVHEAHVFSTLEEMCKEHVYDN